MEVANKNSYSVYALPAVLLAGSIVTKLRRCPLSIRLALIALSLVTGMAIMLSGNRSGWLGLMVVAILLIKDRKISGLLYVAIFGIVLLYLISSFGDTKIMEHRWTGSQTIEKSDNTRLWLMRTCLEIGLENPILGVSPQGLPFELGRRSTEQQVDFIDPHNLLGHIIGGSGLICFAAFLATGGAIWRISLLKDASKFANGAILRSAILTLRSMVILWIVRGMFTREILYNPGASIGLGLAIGWCILERERRDAIIACNVRKITL